MKVNDTTSRIGVYYTNGFLISYPNNSSSYKQVMAVDTDSNWHNEKLFKYLINKGWIRGAYGPKVCYADGSTVWVNVGDEVLNWEFHRTPFKFFP